MRGKRIIGILLSGMILLSGSVIAFAADNAGTSKAANISVKENISNDISVNTDKKEPLAELQVITDKEEISKITSENPEIKEYLEQNEPFAELEIITDQSEIEKIWAENPDVKALMQSKTYYYLAYVKGNGVRLRKSPSTSATINGLLYESKKDWVLLNDNYSLNENYIWWEVADSSIGFPGWIVNDYIYLRASTDTSRNAADVPEIDFDTLKFIQ
mgnify:CR=1 FL=1